MFWTVEKLQARINELDLFRYRDEMGIDTFRIKLDAKGAIGAYPSEDGEWSNIRIGDRWQGRDVYYWLAADFVIPSEWKGRKVLGRFKLGQTGDGTNSGFESLLFLNGAPYQGVDSNHEEEVFLPEELIGSSVQLRFRLWSGLGGYQSSRVMESRLDLASVCWLDEACDDLYYTAKAVLETVRILEEQFLLKYGLTSKAIDWLGPEYAMLTVIIMAVWGAIGNYMLLFIAGLQGIPDDLYECASIDGANVIQKFWYITIPMLGPVLQMIVMLAIINSLKGYESIMVMTEGGPFGKTDVMYLYVYKLFFPVSAASPTVQQIGYGSAAGFVTALIVGLITIVYFAMSKRLNQD